MATDNLTEKNNHLFRLYTEKLRVGNPYTFTTFADKLRAWLSSQRAYYTDARPQIVNLLLTAQGTLRRAVGVDPNFGVPFNANDHLDHPITPAYINLIRAVEPYRLLFVEPQLRARIRFLLQSIIAPLGGPDKVEDPATGPISPSKLAHEDVPQLVATQSIPQPPQPPQPTLTNGAGFMAPHEAKNTMNPQSSSLISALGAATLPSETPPTPQPPAAPVSQPIVHSHRRKGRGYLKRFRELDDITTDEGSSITTTASSSMATPQPTVVPTLEVMKQEVLKANESKDVVSQEAQALSPDRSSGRKAGGYIRQFLSLDEDDASAGLATSSTSIIAAPQPISRPEADEITDRDEDEDAFRISQELQTLDPNSVTDAISAPSIISTTVSSPSLPPFAPISNEAPSDPSQLREETRQPVPQQVQLVDSEILQAALDASSSEPSPLASLAPVCEWPPSGVQSTNVQPQGPSTIGEGGLLDNHNVNEVSDATHLGAELQPSTLEPAIDAPPDDVQVAQLPEQVKDGIIRGGPSQHGEPAPDAIESEPSNVQPITDLSGNSTPPRTESATQPSSLDAPGTFADQDTEMTDDTTNSKQRISDSCLPVKRQEAICGASDHQELLPEVSVVDLTSNTLPPHVIPHPDASTFTGPATKDQPGHDSGDDMDLDVPTPTDKSCRLPPILQDDGSGGGVDPPTRTHASTPIHTIPLSEPINNENSAVAPPPDLRAPTPQPQDGPPDVPGANEVGLAPSIKHRMEDEAKAPVAQLDGPPMTDALGLPTSPSTPGLHPRVFGREMTVAGIQMGCTAQGNIKFQFTFPEQQFVYLSKWNNRTKPDVPLNQCLCFSLGCYSVTEFHANLRKDAKLEEHVTFLSSVWPQTGGLDLGVTFHGEPFYLPLSPPFGLTPDGLVDISQFVVSGQNKLELIQRRDIKIEERRLKDQQWQERLNYFARPLDLSRMFPQMFAVDHATSQPSS